MTDAEPTVAELRRAFDVKLHRVMGEIMRAKEAMIRECLRTDAEIANWQWVVQYGPHQREWLQHMPTGKRVEFIYNVKVTP